MGIREQKVLTRAAAARPFAVVWRFLVLEVDVFVGGGRCEFARIDFTGFDFAHNFGGAFQKRFLHALTGHCTRLHKQQI